MINSNDSVQHTLLKKWLWLYIFAFLTAPLGYAIRILLSNELTVSDIWILYWIISLVTLISAYNDLWFTEGIKYYLPKFIHSKEIDKQKSLIWMALWLQIVTSILFWILFYFWANTIASSYLSSPEAAQILKIYSLFFIIVSFFQINSSVFAAIQNTFLEKWTNFLRWLITLFIIWFVILWDLWSLENYAKAFIAWLAVATIISSTLSTKYFYNTIKNGKIIKDIVFYKDIFKYSWVIFLSLQIWILLSQIDLQMVLFILWTESAWYYSNYLSLITIPFVLLWPILWFLLPLFSSLKAQNKESEIINLKQILVKYFSVIAIFAWVFSFVLSKEIAITIFWEKFITSWEILSYSATFIVFNFLLQINFWLLSWIGQASKRVKILSFALGLNFILNLVFIKTIWVAGAALATAIWWVFIFIYSELEIKKLYNFKYDYKFIIKNFLLITFLGAWTLLTKKYAWELERGWYLILILSYLSVYCLATVLTNTNELKNLKTQIKSLKN